MVRLVCGAAACGILAAWYVLLYGDCTRHFFHWDDFRLLGAASRISIYHPADLWQFFSPGPTATLLYRPLSEKGYFWLLGLLFGYDAAPYHAVQLGANVANAVLVYAITSTILQSRRAGLGTALIYAAAPGHTTGVYWNAAFSMTGTAFWYFATLLAWLRLSGRPRGLVCALLFGIALLHGEAAITLPLVLTLSPLIEKTATWRERTCGLLPLYVIAAAYGLAKIWYFRFGLAAQFPDPMGRAFVLSHYGATFAPADVIETLGFYCACAFGWLYAGAGSPSVCAGIGASWLVALGGSLNWARRSDAGRVVAFGLLFFIVSLGPLLVLPNHKYLYLIGVAAFGSSLALVAAARAVPRVGQRLAVGVVATTLAVEVLWAGGLVRRSEEFHFLQGFQATAAGWLQTVQQRAELHGRTREVLVPSTTVTKLVFGDAACQRLFYGATYDVRPVDTLPPPGDPTRIVVAAASPWRPGTAMPGQQPRWDWLRADGRRLVSDLAAGSDPTGSGP